MIIISTYSRSTGSLQVATIRLSYDAIEFSLIGEKELHSMFIKNVEDIHGATFIDGKIKFSDYINESKKPIETGLVYTIPFPTGKLSGLLIMLLSICTEDLYTFEEKASRIVKITKLGLKKKFNSITVNSTEYDKKNPMLKILCGSVIDDKRILNYAKTINGVTVDKKAITLNLNELEETPTSYTQEQTWYLSTAQSIVLKEITDIRNYITGYASAQFSYSKNKVKDAIDLTENSELRSYPTTTITGYNDFISFEKLNQNDKAKNYRYVKSQRDSILLCLYLDIITDWGNLDYE